MPTVTALKPQRNGKRVNVYVDDKFAFGIDLDNLVLSDIKIGATFSEIELNQIIKKAEFQKTFDKLVNFATLRPRSEKEVDMWFKRKDIAESLHMELKQKIKKLGFLNDEEFAKWWVQQRIAFKKSSKRALFAELKQKGIDEKMISLVIDSSMIDELTQATELLAKKVKRWDKLEEVERKQKMAAFLQRLGYNWEIVKDAIKRFDKEEID